MITPEIKRKGIIIGSITHHQDIVKKPKAFAVNNIKNDNINMFIYISSISPIFLV
jgi:hypothetical protein